MSKSITGALLVLSVVLVAACSSNNSGESFVAPTPISTEPASNGKFG